MLAQLLVGWIVVGPVFYLESRITLGQFALYLAFALLVGVCIPDAWHE